MAIDTNVLRESGSKLKISSGWFAAGDSYRRALTMLSDGAFRLFAYISLEAARGTGRFEVSQIDLARALGKSRRIIGQYIAELQEKGICALTPGRNQYARNIIEILDDYWPYYRPTIAEAARRKEEDEYVAEVRDRFLATGCTRGKFGIGDERTAKAMKEQGVSLELLQDALFLGACRKYDSWLNGGAAEPIGSLAYFEPLLSEMRDKPFPPGYREYLHSKVAQLSGMWEETKATAIGIKSERNPLPDK